MCITAREVSNEEGNLLKGILRQSGDPFRAIASSTVTSSVAVKHRQSTVPLKERC